MRLEEDAELERKRVAAARLAYERGLQTRGHLQVEPSVSETKAASAGNNPSEETPAASKIDAPPPDEFSEHTENNFVPARLPNFG